MAGLNDTLWLTLSLRDAPARVAGPWTFSHQRTFQDSGRVYHALLGVWSEPLD